MLHNTREERILTHLRRNKATEVLFHHRFPTSTDNVRNACHPFSTKGLKKNYVLVHNGVIFNADDVKKKHDEMGLKYVSDDGVWFNDSEALAYDVALYLEGKQDRLECSGSIAFICVEMDKRGKPKYLYFGRNNGNPLMMKHTPYSLTLSSEGVGIPIDIHTLYKMSYKTGKLAKTPLTIPSGYHNASGYMGFGAYEYEDDELRYAKTLQSWEPKETENTERVQKFKEELLNLCDWDYEAAFNLGEMEVLKRQQQAAALNYTVNIYNDATYEEKAEYYAIKDELYYLEEAMKEIEKEASEYFNSQGFPVTVYESNGQRKLLPATYQH